MSNALPDQLHKFRRSLQLREMTTSFKFYDLAGRHVFENGCFFSLAMGEVPVAPDEGDFLMLNIQGLLNFRTETVYEAGQTKTAAVLQALHGGFAKWFPVF